MAEQYQFTTQTSHTAAKLLRSSSVSTMDQKQSEPKSSPLINFGDRFSYADILGYQKSNNPEQFLRNDMFLSDSSQLYKNCQPSITDRFIPCRKSLHTVSFCDSDLDTENEEKYLEVQPSHYEISDIYRKYVMNKSVSNLETEKREIQPFSSHNTFKFNKSERQCVSRGTYAKDHEEMYDDLSKYKKKRNINKIPLKVLDAPSLQNDFYLNVIDWSKDNIIAVGLSSNVYLWNGENCRVTKLCDVGVVDSVCSLSWSLKQPHLAVGSSNGEIKIWDVEKLRKIRCYRNHTNRVCAVAWSSNTICSGSRDKLIYESDPRCEDGYLRKLQYHKQEICGLKWSPDQQQFCSGGNDNKLLVWNNHSSQPIHKFADHQAAVKAVAWSPYQRGLLVSGGGTADRTIKFRNTLVGETVKSMNVGSQVCNLTFSKNFNELVSTHGYSQNEINIWKCPKMQKIATLTGHTLRVLYLAMSPDGSTIVTGAGDETLRFWNVFPQAPKQEQTRLSELKVDSTHLR